MALVLLALAHSSAGLAAVVGAPKSGGPIGFSGRAFVLDASGKVLRADTQVDAGVLPVEGGARQVGALSGAISNVVSGDLLHAVMVGEGNQCFAEASLANLNLTVGGQRITAGFVAGRSSAIVRDGRVHVTGRTEVVGLAVNGRPIAVSGMANQRIALSNGYLVINEQKATITSASGDLLVWALRAVIKEVGAVGVGLTQVGLSVGTPRRCDRDFVTGSGWITEPASRQRLFFSFAAGNRDGTLDGHLHFLDPRGIRLATTEVTTYTVINSTTRLITGNLEYNGAPGLGYRLEVTDGDGVGQSDQFTLILGNTYAARGFLQGGNVRLFRCP